MVSHVSRSMFACQMTLDGMMGLRANPRRTTAAGSPGDEQPPAAGAYSGGGLRGPHFRPIAGPGADTRASPSAKKGPELNSENPTTFRTLQRILCDRRLHCKPAPTMDLCRLPGGAAAPAIRARTANRGHARTPSAQYWRKTSRATASRRQPRDGKRWFMRPSPASAPATLRSPLAAHRR